MEHARSPLFGHNVSGPRKLVVGHQPDALYCLEGAVIHNGEPPNSAYCRRMTASKRPLQGRSSEPVSSHSETTELAGVPWYAARAIHEEPTGDGLVTYCCLRAEDHRAINA